MPPERGDTTLGPCPVCGRAMIDGPSVNRHHWIPRAYGGQDWATLHVICHKKIHSVLSDRDLATQYATADAIRAHPEISAFVRWVRRRPPEYMDRHDRPRSR